MAKFMRRLSITGSKTLYTLVVLLSIITAARSIAQAEAHKKELNRDEQKTNPDNQRCINLMKGLEKRIDGVYVGTDDDVSVETVEDVADAVLAYLASEI
jgi:hypothetical protein